MALSFGFIQYIFGIQVTDLKTFVVTCVCFFLMSIFTEFLNLLQTNLYKFNLDRSLKRSLKLTEAATHHDQHVDEHYNDEDYSDVENESINDDTESAVHSSLLKHISTKMYLAETSHDYDRLFNSSKKLTSRMTEARFKKLLFALESLVYFLQTVISYSLMQAIMAENFWIFLSILFGYVLGYFLFYNDLDINLILFAKLFEIYKRNFN